jgi:hypothetical protein
MPPRPMPVVSSLSTQNYGVIWGTLEVSAAPDSVLLEGIAVRSSQLAEEGSVDTDRYVLRR